jgi:zinc finger protein
MRALALHAQQRTDVFLRSDHIGQSETCGLEIPEIDLILQPGTLGGRFTTLEGILTQVYEELNEKVFASGGAGGGDSRKGGGAGNGEEVQMGGFEKFLLGLKAVRLPDDRALTIRITVEMLTRPSSDPPLQIMNAERPFTLILDDPLANSYLQNPCASSSRERRTCPATTCRLIAVSMVSSSLTRCPRPGPGNDV